MPVAEYLQNVHCVSLCRSLLMCLHPGLTPAHVTSELFRRTLSEFRPVWGYFESARCRLFPKKWRQSVAADLVRLIRGRPVNRHLCECVRACVCESGRVRAGISAPSGLFPFPPPRQSLTLEVDSCCMHSLRFTAA